MEPWFRLFVDDVKFLTLAGTGHFESFHGIRGLGLGTTPCRFALD